MECKGTNYVQQTVNAEIRIVPEWNVKRIKDSFDRQGLSIRIVPEWNVKTAIDPRIEITRGY